MTFMLAHLLKDAISSQFQQPGTLEIHFRINYDIFMLQNDHHDEPSYHLSP